MLACGDNYNNGATGGSANAVVVEHNHTQNAHTHTGTDGREFVTHIDGKSISENRIASGTNYYAPTITSSDNWYSVGSVGNATPTINNRGESGTGKNMPPYLAVYCWVRTA